MVTRVVGCTTSSRICERVIVGSPDRRPGRRVDSLACPVNSTHLTLAARAAPKLCLLMISDAYETEALAGNARSCFVCPETRFRLRRSVGRSHRALAESRSRATSGCRKQLIMDGANLARSTSNPDRASLSFFLSTPDCLSLCLADRSPDQTPSSVRLIRTAHLCLSSPSRSLSPRSSDEPRRQPGTLITAPNANNTLPSRLTCTKL